MAFERKTTTGGRKGGGCNIFLINKNYCHVLGWRSPNVAPDTQDFNNQDVMLWDKKLKANY